MKRRECVKCGKRRAERFYLSSRARVCDSCKRQSRRKAAHAHRVQVTYGLQPGDYDSLLAAQHGVCAVCFQSRNYKLNVDHDHKLVERRLGEGVEPNAAHRESVRGLLCRRCNKLLAIVGDNAELLVEAARYLTNPPARSVLGPFSQGSNRGS